MLKMSGSAARKVPSPGGVTDAKGSGDHEGRGRRLVED
jgi:hypothetical protein